MNLQNFWVVQLKFAPFFLSLYICSEYFVVQKRFIDIMPRFWTTAPFSERLVSNRHSAGQWHHFHFHVAVARLQSVTARYNDPLSAIRCVFVCRYILSLLLLLSLCLVCIGPPADNTALFACGKRRISSITLFIWEMKAKRSWFSWVLMPNQANIAAF